jgi:hypothetical protein
MRPPSRVALLRSRVFVQQPTPEEVKQAAKARDAVRGVIDRLELDLLDRDD